MSTAHPATLPIEELLKACQESRTRGSGPGGQHRNKVETAVVLTHLPTQVAGAASERRSQKENRQQALQRLRVHLALAVRTQNEVPLPLWRKYVRAEKIRISEANPDFPALLANALDLVSRDQGDLAPAAKILGLTSTQLLKFLRIEPAAWQCVLGWRRNSGLRELK